MCTVSNNVSKNGRTLMSAEYWLKNTGEYNNNRKEN